MRVLVALHNLTLGGSQLNALDFAVAARDRGHEVVLYSVYGDPIHHEDPIHADQPGPMAEKIRAAGLRLILDRHPRDSPERMLLRRAVVRKLSHIVAQDRIDLVHAYEIPMIVDSFYGPHLRLGIPLVGTIYGLYVPWWLPRYPPLITGTREIADRAALHRTQPPVLIEPPVNTDTDSPAVVDGTAFRRAHGLGTDIVVGVVSRLEPSAKIDSIELSMRAIEFLDEPRIRLVVTGGGPSFSALSTLAERVNAALRRRAVVMTGPLADPRPAYAAADIALGMGSSALRAMAFGKPLIVLGVQGFAKPLQPATAQEFLFGGFFGVGVGDLDPRPLAASIRELADRPQLRSELGAFSSQLVWDRFSLKAASATLEDVYATAIRQPHPREQRWREAARVAVCKTGSDGLPETVKNGLRPVVRPLSHARGRS
jgi:glycosyltransferase involved in cell wall biosynthesis